MARKRRYSTEQIITKLREADVLLSQGKSADEISRSLEISKQTCYRWRKEYGGLNMTQAKKLKELESFLGFTIKSQGINENIKSKLDETSAFYSASYGKAVTTSPIGKYKNSLNSEQIKKIKHVFSYYMNNLNYR